MSLKYDKDGDYHSSDKLLSRDECIKRIQFLINCQSGRKGKYYRNYRLYTGNPTADLDAKIPQTVGYLPQNYSDTLEEDTPKYNVCQSIIDTLVSKVSQARCRPYINTMEGSYTDIQIGKSLQVFFDNFCDEEMLNNLMADIFRDACVFDTGYIFYNWTKQHLIRVKPWNVYLASNETNSKNLKQAYIEFPDMPIDEIEAPDEVMKYIEENVNSDSCRLGYYFCTHYNTIAYLVNRKVVHIDSWGKVIPIIPLYYTNPIIGRSAMGVCDLLSGIQSQIDLLMRNITEASRLNPGMTLLVRNGSGIKVGQLNNRLGNILQYDGDDGTAISTMTPNFIAGQYIDTLNDLITKAYNLVGISELSSQSKKPSGLDSGIAIATMESLESDRFEKQLKQYISMFTQIARMIIWVNCDVYADDNISANDMYVLPVTWRTVNDEMNKLKIQFSAADSLSKDPSEKLKQLQALAEAGILPQSKIGVLMEMPDLQTGFNAITNGINAADAIIDKCINGIPYDIPSYISFELLKEEIINTQLLLQSTQGRTDSNKEDIEKLDKLYQEVIDEENNLSGSDDMSSQSTDGPTDVSNYEFGNQQNVNTVTGQQIGRQNPYDTTVPVETTEG